MSTEPKDIAFDNASINRDHNIYTEEYYGGADAFIYINGERCEGISALSFEVRETVKPIYSYASRIYDDLAVGTRIVQGMIKVPVKNRGPVDRITIDDNSGYNELSNEGTVDVPNWVYKYKPKIEEITSANNNEQYENENTDRQTIANVQQALIQEAKEKGETTNVVVNGVNDFNTKMAIANYKKENNLTVNSNCDLELTNRLINSKDNLGKAAASCMLRYLPQDDAAAIGAIAENTKLVVQKYIDSTWLLVQVDQNVKGYIKRSEIIF